jgi:signal transduction histidine kinase
MSTESEELLRETLLNVERARTLARGLQLESEALLRGFQRIADAEPDEIFARLIEVLGEVLRFEGAFIVEFDEDGLGRARAATHDGFRGVRWELEGPFKRALDRRPVALFDVREVHAWRMVAGCMPIRVTSALLGGITTSTLRAVLVCTHSRRAFFTRGHARLLGKFSPLAAGAVLRIRALERERELLARTRWTNVLLRREIGERIAAERQLRQAQILMLQNEEQSALGRLVAGVARELHHPLAFVTETHDTIQARLDVLRRMLMMQLPALGSAAREHAEALFADLHDLATRHRRGTTRMASFVESLGKLSERDVEGFSRASIDEVIRETLTIVRPKWGRLSIVHRPCKIELECRPFKLTQALMNLLDRAADAALHACGERRGRVVIESERDGEDILIRVSDNGGELPEEQRVGLLNSLAASLRSSASAGGAVEAGERAGPRTSIGIEICRSIVEEHRGTLGAHEVGEGMCFTLRLPRSQDGSEVSASTPP